MLDEKVDLVAGDFNVAAWRRTTSASTLSIIEKAFADCDLPWPPGPTPLWGPGAVPGTWSDVCGFIEPPDSNERWKVRQHDAFSFLHEALGIRQTDQSCHHEVWLHLDFVERRCGQSHHERHERPLFLKERPARMQATFRYLHDPATVRASSGRELPYNENNVLCFTPLLPLRSTRPSACDLMSRKFFLCQSRVFRFFSVLLISTTQAHATFIQHPSN